MVTFALMALQVTAPVCFEDRLGIACVRALRRSPSGRVEVEVSRRGGAFIAEVGDGVVVEATRPVALVGLRFERTLFGQAGLHLYRAVGGDAVAAAGALRGRLSAGVHGVSPELWLPRVRAAFPVTAPNDPRYGGQWYHPKIRIEEAWRRTVGAPEVEIAVVDDGCDTAHPDLRSQLLPGRDVVDGDDDPSFTPGESGNNHGTACAGLVAAATDNGEAIAGTCPGCRLRCVRLIAPRGALVPESADVEAFSFAHQHGVAVISNSWGFGPGVPAPASLVTAIETVVREGRGGLGAVVVFAAGNDDGLIGADQVAALPGVIAVGAVNLFDEATPFSNRGEALALVAPAGTVTLDLTDEEGSDPGDVTTSFGGTSSAAPLVAGVAGLMLSLRPELTAAEVREVLQRTARRAPFARPDERGHDLQYGSGILDAAAALAAVAPPVQLPLVQASGAAAGCGCSTIDPGAAFVSATLVLVLLGLFTRRRP